MIYFLLAGPFTMIFCGGIITHIGHHPEKFGGIQWFTVRKLKQHRTGIHQYFSIISFTGTDSILPKYFPTYPYFQSTSLSLIQQQQTTSSQGEITRYSSTHPCISRFWWFLRSFLHSLHQYWAYCHVILIGGSQEYYIPIIKRDSVYIDPFTNCSQYSFFSYGNIQDCLTKLL